MLAILAKLATSLFLLSPSCVAAWWAVKSWNAGPKFPEAELWFAGLVLGGLGLLAGALWLIALMWRW